MKQLVSGDAGEKLNDPQHFVVSIHVSGTFKTNR